MPKTSPRQSRPAHLRAVLPTAATVAPVSRPVRQAALALPRPVKLARRGAVA